MVGLIVIWTIFQSLNPIFLSSNNLVNMLFDASTVGLISLGIVCVLMVGEIDLSVGSVSGFASAAVGVLWVDQGWPVWAAIGAAVASGALIGWIYAQLYNRFGMPSFVSTLAGLLAVLGLQLYVLGRSGSINLPYGSGLVNLGQSLFIRRCSPMRWSPSPVPGCSATTSAPRRGGVPPASPPARSAGRCSGPRCSRSCSKSWSGISTRIAACRGCSASSSAWSRLLSYLLTRTRWGRAVHAVGGNREAARRAGINVRAIYTSAFVTCSALAAFGGVMASARLASASQQAGTGDVNLNAIAAR